MSRMKEVKTLGLLFFWSDFKPLGIAQMNGEMMNDLITSTLPNRSWVSMPLFKIRDSLFAKYEIKH